MNDIKNIIFDIGGIVTEETGAKAFTHLSKMEIKVLDNIVFYDKRFNEVIQGKISSKEYFLSRFVLTSSDFAPATLETAFFPESTT